MLSFPLVAMSAEREELYRLGVTADKNKDCIHTIKYLYAFYIINEKSLGDHSKLKISLEQKISRCSSQLKRKLALYEQLSSVKTKKTDGGIIAITAQRKEGNRLLIEVIDDGPGVPDHEIAGQKFQPSKGVGISNIRNRLQEIYGESYELIFTNAEPRGLRVTILIPYERN